jgi:glycosyltransferase involved in cell wall biosynthesis
MLASGDGGAETFFEKLAIAFEQRGIRQILVIQPHQAREMKLRAAGCDVRVVRLNGWRKHLARWQIARIVRETGSNVVLGWMSRGAAAVPDIPGVAKLARVGGYYKGKYFRRFDKVVVNAPQLIGHLEAGGVSREKLQLIPNFAEALSEHAFDVNEVRQRFGIGENHFVAASIGRLHQVKGHDLAIRVVARIPQLYLLIAGEGSEREALHQLAEELGVKDRVYFLGWHREMGEVFTAADIILFPTRSEPFGNVVVEAWREQVPIISSDIEGPAWLIDDGVNGLLCEADNGDMFETAVRRLMDSPTLRQKLVSAGLRKLETSFSADAVVQAYQQLFNEVSQ